MHGRPPCGAARVFDLPFAALNFAILSGHPKKW
jgi:hypothetical protein